jgi:hypothetical protein
VAAAAAVGQLVVVAVAAAAVQAAAVTAGRTLNHVDHVDSRRHVDLSLFEYLYLHKHEGVSIYSICTVLYLLLYVQYI